MMGYVLQQSGRAKNKHKGIYTSKPNCGYTYVAIISYKHISSIYQARIAMFKSTMHTIHLRIICMIIM